MKGERKMDEYIKRAAIMEFPIRKDHCDKERANEHFIFGIESVLEYVESLPAADVAPVVHGRWLRADDFVICSRCEAEMNQKNSLGVDNFKNFCPNCGARMDGDSNAFD